MLSSPERPAVCGLDQWRAARGCYRVRAHGLRQDLADLCRPNGVPPRPWAATSGVLYIDPSSRGVVPVGGQPAMQQAVRRVVREICNCESELHDDTYITSPPRRARACFTSSRRSGDPADHVCGAGKVEERVGLDRWSASCPLVGRTEYAWSISGAVPVRSVKPGMVLKLWTEDCFAGKVWKKRRPGVRRL